MTAVSQLVLDNVEGEGAWEESRSSSGHQLASLCVGREGRRWGELWTDCPNRRYFSGWTDGWEALTQNKSVSRSQVKREVGAGVPCEDKGERTYQFCELG